MRANTWCMSNLCDEEAHSHPPRSFSKHKFRDPTRLESHVFAIVQVAQFKRAHSVTTRVRHANASGNHPIMYPYPSDVLGAVADSPVSQSASSATASNTMVPRLLVATGVGKERNGPGQLKNRLFQSAIAAKRGNVARLSRGTGHRGHSVTPNK